MRSPQYIPSFYFYKFANAVAGPYTSLGAYRNGLIDQYGNILDSEGSFDDFEYFVIKLKKIFDQLPPGLTKAQLTNVNSILSLFSEGVEDIGVTQEQLLSLMEAHVIYNSNNEVSLIELLEDMGTAGMSTGSASGELGTPAEAPEANKGNVSGYDPKLGEILTRNSPVNMFAGIEMFNVSPEEFQKFKQSKAWRHLPDSPTKRYLQRFQRRNKEGKMAVRDEASGDVFFIPYKEKSFMEEFGLQGLSILSENKLDEPVKASIKAIENADKDGQIDQGKSSERLAQFAIRLRNAILARVHGDNQAFDRNAEEWLTDAGKPTLANGADSRMLSVNPNTNSLEFVDVDAKKANGLDRGFRVTGVPGPGADLMRGVEEYTEMMNLQKSGAAPEEVNAARRRFMEVAREKAPGVRSSPRYLNLTPEQQKNLRELGTFAGSRVQMPLVFQGKDVAKYFGKSTLLVPTEVMQKALTGTEEGRQQDLDFRQKWETRYDAKKRKLDDYVKSSQSIIGEFGSAALKRAGGIGEGQPLPSISATVENPQNNQLSTLVVNPEDLDVITQDVGPSEIEQIRRMLERLSKRS
jgi:hypothetical protein